MGFSIEALVGKEQQQGDKSSPPRSGSSPGEDTGRTFSPRQQQQQAPVAPVPTFPGGVPASLAGAGGGMAFLDSICGGGRPGLYHPHEHPGGYTTLSGGCSPHVSPFFLGRETYPLYPWLLARHPRFLAHRLPG
ncbi:uncharacterized protein CEXT_148311 [Caerostris extrusa]|uniref:Uncharacterized protein n=1 Tax=Caerostris extrusa TaxID=172846 RepID=A0AAV4TXG8_CAEEX|nr:uncharacterized protein CEXT_148311 [Caerostris extrusa]